MMNIKAKIDLLRVRKTAFVSGYRPLFNFIAKTKTSGKITLLDRNEFLPGDTAIVEISFVDRAYLGSDFGPGTQFTFDEGGEPIGRGTVVEILKP